MFHFLQWKCKTGNPGNFTEILMLVGDACLEALQTVVSQLKDGFRQL